MLISCGCRWKGVGPVRHAALDDAAEDGFELVVRHEERVVLWVHPTVVVGKVQADAVGQLDHHERAVNVRLTQAEDLGQEPR